MANTPEKIKYSIMKFHSTDIRHQNIPFVLKLLRPRIVSLLGNMSQQEASWRAGPDRQAPRPWIWSLLVPTTFVETDILPVPCFPFLSSSSANQKS